MKRKLLYEAPLTEEFELVLGSSCLQNVSDINSTNPTNPMPWDPEDDDNN